MPPPDDLPEEGEPFRQLAVQTVPVQPDQSPAGKGFRIPVPVPAVAVDFPGGRERSGKDGWFRKIIERKCSFIIPCFHGLSLRVGWSGWWLFQDLQDAISYVCSHTVGF